MSGAGLRLPLAAALLFALAACVPASRVTPVSDFAELAANDVLLVGKVRLDPPLAADEQDLGSIAEEFRNVAILVTDAELRPVHELAYGDLDRRIDAPFDGTFFVRYPAEPFYILRGWVVMRAKIATGSDGLPANAPLNGVFKVDLRPGDRAVYIGTIEYRRDEFFDTAVAVKDEYARANAEFRERFGNGVSLRKALAQPVSFNQ